MASESLPPIRVLVTGAAGRICYSLIPLLLSGTVFGSNRRVDLRLFDIPMMGAKLDGIKMEIYDSDYELLHNVVASSDAAEAYPGVDVAILVGGVPRMAGMERKDLTVQNAENIKQQATFLEQYASPDTKVIVVANPANTNCLVAMHCAPKIPKRNFSCLTRLDQQRLQGLCAAALNSKSAIGEGEGDKALRSRHIHEVYIFGNHSTTQVAYIDTGFAKSDDGSISNKLRDTITDSEFTGICDQVQGRGGAIIKATGMSSALSAAEAVAKHVRDICHPSMPTQPFSIGITSDSNPYGVPDNLVFSFPCRRIIDDAGVDRLEIVSGLDIRPDTQRMLDLTVTELEGERADILHFF
jgi:malate dehydrogenase